MRLTYPKGHPFYGVGPEDGVHVLGNKWGQRSYIEEQSLALAPGVGIAVDATRKVVPRRPERSKDFRMDRVTPGPPIGILHPSSEERLMEQALYLPYRPGGEFGSTDAWSQLIAFQVPLYDYQGRNWLGSHRPSRAHAGRPAGRSRIEEARFAGDPAEGHAGRSRQRRGGGRELAIDVSRGTTAADKGEKFIVMDKNGKVYVLCVEGQPDKKGVSVYEKEPPNPPR